MAERVRPRPSLPRCANLSLCRRPRLRFERFDPLQHFAPHAGRFALAFSVETIDLHRSVQEGPRPMLALDFQRTGPKLFVAGHAVTGARLTRNEDDLCLRG